ncbi:HAD family hydrolase [Anaerocolumna sp. MB42-C2]|uniref:HAD family hydrolase n=1 Tax=Anaerocolumna sp. MB42-C2 TaxID=3070997 RepID=UPI0027E07FBC|nr:HAD family hydrolase [Anaerocolumna sp. MB42-C2]WMJ90636.1 HAD family hydrolase [Anaerocolumna sp. MB42-C2]
MNTFIFDLDGTLLPMPSQELFLDAYFKALSGKLIPYGIDIKKLVKAVWTGTNAMIQNDGTMTNDQRFWNTFSELLGEEIRQLEPVFEEFYKNEFNSAKITTGTNPIAKDCIQLLKKKGYTVVLATNPIFPQIATYSRIGWAGLDVKDFAHITTYENSKFCKPNLNYYKEILTIIDKSPKECIMVGNDVKEDMCAANLGMDTFLLKDCLICTDKEDISQFKQGGFEDLLELIKGVPALR